MKYIAVKNLLHSKTGKLIKPGESVDLSHLDKKQIENLLEIGAIAKSKKEQKDE